MKTQTRKTGKQNRKKGEFTKRKIQLQRKQNAYDIVRHAYENNLTEFQIDNKTFRVVTEDNPAPGYGYYGPSPLVFLALRGKGYVLGDYSLKDDGYFTAIVPYAGMKIRGVNGFFENSKPVYISEVVDSATGEMIWG